MTTPSSLTDSLRTQLRNLIDPELDINVVDLGLIRGIKIVGSSATVTMTLTSPGCPLGETLRDGVRHLAVNTPGITNVTVDLNWDPPWSPDDISPDARNILN